MRIKGFRPAAILAAALAFGMVLSGCQTGINLADGDSADEAPPTVELVPLEELTPVADPRSIEGPVKVQIGGPTLTPIADHPEYTLPVTVVSKDLDGSRPEITVTDNTRILALSVTGSLADLVVSLGFADNLVGKDLATTAPGTEDLPLVVTPSHTINQEAILALQPTVVFTDGSIGPDDALRIQLRQVGIPVVATEKINDFESTYQATRDIAAALGAPQLGEELITEMKTAIDDKVAQIQEFVPSDPAKVPSIVFLYLRGTAGIYFMFGEGSGVDTIINAVGARDLATENGWRGEKPLTPEALPALNPDIIMVMEHGLESVGGVEGLIANVPGVAQTRAGQTQRIFEVHDTLLFAGGSRTPDVLDGLARALYTADNFAG